MQAAISGALQKIKGRCNIEDARQDAYSAIADEQPLTVEDAVRCAIRAIERARNGLRASSGREIQYNDEADYNNWHDAYDENDSEFLEPARIDRELFMGTEAGYIPHISACTRAEIMHEREDARDRGRLARERMRREGLIP